MDFFTCFTKQFFLHLYHACMFMCIIVQEEQIQKVKILNTTKLQQLDSAIQEKLEQAQNRKVQLEQEQKEKLRNHVSTLFFLYSIYLLER